MYGMFRSGVVTSTLRTSSFLSRLLITSTSLTDSTFNTNTRTFGCHFGNVGLVEPHCLNRTALVLNDCGRHGDSALETFACFESGNFSKDDGVISFAERVNTPSLGSVTVAYGDMIEEVSECVYTKFAQGIFLDGGNTEVFSYEHVSSWLHTCILREIDKKR